jgi:hypothetical protein
MIGRRLPLGTYPREPGDYMGPIVHDGRLTVFFLKPNARDPGAPKVARAIHHAVSPPHVFRECPDGSLEIRESLGDWHEENEGEKSDGWHGFLDEGHVWRKGLGRVEGDRVSSFTHVPRRHARGRRPRAPRSIVGVPAATERFPVPWAERSVADDVVRSGEAPLDHSSPAFVLRRSSAGLLDAGARRGAGAPADATAAADLGTRRERLRARPRLREAHAFGHEGLPLLFLQSLRFPAAMQLDAGYRQDRPDRLGLTELSQGTEVGLWRAVKGRDLPGFQVLVARVARVPLAAAQRDQPRAAARVDPEPPRREQALLLCAPASI